MSLYIGIVVAAYPEGRSIDVLLEDSSRLTNVQVVGIDAMSDASGIFDMVDPGYPTDETRWDYATRGARIIRAIIGSLNGQPICMGFLPPQANQMTFQRKNFRVARHPSDVYSTINDTGDFEFFHPSGTYFRVGVSSAHEDLTGQDFDGLWQIARNTDKAPSVHLEVWSGGERQAAVDIDPNGNLDAQLEGTANIQATQITGTAAGGINLNGFKIDASGNAHTTGTVTGDTDVIAAGKSGKGHDHSGGTISGNTGPPI